MASEKLTDNDCRKAEPRDKPYKMADGHGLYLNVMPDGAKYWRYKFRIAEKERVMGFGVYPKIGLAAARRLHGEAYELVKAGKDPMAERQETKKAAETEEMAKKLAKVTFADVAKQWLKEQVPAKDHASKTNDRNERMVHYLVQAFGKKPIAEVHGRDLVTLLITFQDEGKYETRVRLQGVAKNVMNFAMGRFYVDVNPFGGVNNNGKSFLGTKKSRKKRPALIYRGRIWAIAPQNRPLRRPQRESDRHWIEAIGPDIRPTGRIDPSQMGPIRFRAAGLVGAVRNPEAEDATS